MMSTLNCFGIIFDNPAAEYQAGEMIRGKVIVDLSNSLEVKGIFVNFSGGANVDFQGNDGEQLEFYKASESYFDTNVTVFGNDAGDHLIHPAGRQEHPFQMLLPRQIPPSFRGGYGRVTYRAKATIVKPRKLNNHCKRPFTVLCSPDVDRIIGRQRHCGSAQTNLCCLCCISGPISATFTVDSKVYAAGEFVTVSGEIVNRSRRTCSSEIKLRMVTNFYARHSFSRTTKTTVTSVTRGAIRPGDTDIWSGERFQIPTTTLSRLSHCTIMNIDYYVVLKVKPGGLEVPLRVSIATVPLRNIQAKYSETITTGAYQLWC